MSFLSTTIIFSIIYLFSCLTSYGQNMKDQKYGLCYKTEGKHEGLYENLVEIKLINENVKNIVEYAKEVAKKAGYSIRGNNLDKYNLENKDYPIEIKIYENSKYYLIRFLPQQVPETSQDLEITIQKSNKRIITILMGS